MQFKYGTSKLYAMLSVASCLDVFSVTSVAVHSYGKCVSTRKFTGIELGSRTLNWQLWQALKKAYNESRGKEVPVENELKWRIEEYANKHGLPSVEAETLKAHGENLMELLKEWLQEKREEQEEEDEDAQYY